MDTNQTRAESSTVTEQEKAFSAQGVTEAVQARYARAAATVLGHGAELVAGDGGGCCTPAGEGAGQGVADAANCTSGCSSEITSNLYDPADLDSLPATVKMASLGCGNPFALADLSDGETVLDLGSGGGIDVLLSARRVGATGWAFGLDMTPEMLELARRNAAEAGARNVTFLQGTIDRIPLPGQSVDVVMSNCVVNLAADKRAVFTEAFRVLRPGGRLAISDIIARDGQGLEARGEAATAEGWSACMDGALEEADLLGLLRSVGFDDPEIEITREYEGADLAHLRSGFIRAWKPVGADEAEDLTSVSGEAAGAAVGGLAGSVEVGPDSAADPGTDAAGEPVAAACCGTDCCA